MTSIFQSLLHPTEGVSAPASVSAPTWRRTYIAKDEAREAVERTIAFINSDLTVGELSKASQVNMGMLRKLLTAMVDEGKILIVGDVVRIRSPLS